MADDEMESSEATEDLENTILAMLDCDDADGLGDILDSGGGGQTKERMQEWMCRAVASGNVMCLSSLLKHGVDINARNDHGESALTAAVTSGELNVVTCLLDAGADIYCRRTDDSSALDVACRKGDMQTTRAILARLVADTRACAGSANYTPENQKLLYTAMLAAISNKDWKLVEELIQHGAHPDLNLDDDTGSVLFNASEVGSLECVDVLLTHGADVEILRRSGGDTPLMRAALYGHEHIVRRLLETGVRVDRQTTRCSSALVLACTYGHDRLVDLLIDHGANPHQLNPFGFSALYMGTDNAKIVTSLLRHGVDVNTICDDRGETPLHLAAIVGNVESTRLILGAGADINFRTIHNENAFWLAVWKGHYATAHLLVQWNCDVNVPSNGYQVFVSRYMPLELAIGGGELDMVQLLLTAGSVLKNTIYFRDSEPGFLKQLPWLQLREEVLQFLEANDTLLSWVQDYITNPLRLKQICRLCIRQRLGTEIMRKLTSLPIPALLHKFLLFEDIRPT